MSVDLTWLEEARADDGPRSVLLDTPIIFASLQRYLAEQPKYHDRLRACSYEALEARGILEHFLNRISAWILGRGVEGYFFRELLDRSSIEEELLPLLQEHVRSISAEVLWDGVFGESLGYKKFDNYLKSIPEVPDSLVAHDEGLRFLALADPCLGIMETASLIFGSGCDLYDHQLMVWAGNATCLNPEAEIKDYKLPPHRYKTPQEPFWFRHDDGVKNRGCQPNECQEDVTGDVVVGTAMVGLMAYRHHPEILQEGRFAIDLPGTVRSGVPFCCACIGTNWQGEPFFAVHRQINASKPESGTLRFRLK